MYPLLPYVPLKVVDEMCKIVINLAIDCSISLKFRNLVEHVNMNTKVQGQGIKDQDFRFTA